MIWIVLTIAVLAVLCIAMSCVALRYRGKWKDAEELSRKRLKAYEECRYEYDRMGDSISALNIEVDAVKELLNQSEFQFDILRMKSNKMCEMIVTLLDENNRLRKQLPKRDSKGRFCKK